MNALYFEGILYWNEWRKITLSKWRRRHSESTQLCRCHHDHNLNIWKATSIMQRHQLIYQKIFCYCIIVAKAPNTHTSLMSSQLDDPYFKIINTNQFFKLESDSNQWTRVIIISNCLVIKNNTIEDNQIEIWNDNFSHTHEIHLNDFESVQYWQRCPVSSPLCSCSITCDILTVQVCISILQMHMLIWIWIQVGIGVEPQEMSFDWPVFHKISFFKRKWWAISKGNTSLKNSNWPTN